MPRGEGSPRVDGGGVLVGEDQHPVAGAGGEVAGGDREAVAGGRDDGDAVGVGADQGGEPRAQPLDVVEPVRALDLPWCGARGERRLARGAD